MVAPSPDVCPKCGVARRDGQVACSRCGLASDRMESFAKERDASIPEVLVTAWDRAVEAWDEPARHDEVLRLVAQHDAYAWAAAQYRGRAGDPVGDRQLARIRKAAEATLFASATARKEQTAKPYRALTAVMLMLIVAAVAGLLYAMVMRDQAEPMNNATPAPAIRQQQPSPGSQVR